MAENKKSVVLYCDLIHTVNELSNEEAGVLFKHYLSYINDLNPVAPDKLTQIVFEPIKQNLKRDLKKWTGSKETKSDAGAFGNLKRWNEDLYNKVINNELELNEALKIADRRTAIKKSQTVADDRTAIKKSQTIANVAVNVNANVNATVTSSVIGKGKVWEFLRGAAPISIPDTEIEAEADKLLIEYQGKKIGNLRALCNAWINNYQEQITLPDISPVKKMVI